MYLRVGELIQKLKEFDKNLPVVVTKDSKGHQFGVDSNDVKIIEGAYFGNDMDAACEFDINEDGNDKFLNIALI